MANPLITEGEFIDATESHDPDLNQAFYEFTDQIKAEANSGGSIAVFEVPVDANGMARPNTLRKPKLFTVPVGSCTFDDICDRVLREFVEPGGSILIQLLGRQEGKGGHRFNKLVPLRRGKASEHKSDGTTSGEIAQLMRMMNEQRARDLVEMRSLIEANRAPQVDPLTQALAISERITSMSLAARGAAPAAQVASDPNNVMNQMMTLMMSSMMKKFLAGMDGSKEKESDNTNILQSIADLAKPLLAGKAAAEELALVREKRLLRHEAATTAPAPAAPNANPEPKRTIKQENDMKLLAMLNSALPMIIDGVVLKGGDPISTAKLLLDEIPEDDTGLNDAVYQLIQSPPAEFNGKLALADKRVAEHVEWFEKLRVALLSEFDPDERVPRAEKGAS